MPRLSIGVFIAAAQSPDSVLVQCQCPRTYLSTPTKCPLPVAVEGGPEDLLPWMQKLPGEARGHGALVTVPWLLPRL